MGQILGIGLSQDVVGNLTRNFSARVYAATSVAEARMLLQHLDFESVIVDLRGRPLDFRQLCELMGEAPLTTRFLTLRNEESDIDDDALEELGVTALQLPGMDALLHAHPR